MTEVLPGQPLCEEWRPIPGWSAYEASSLGRIRRCRPGAARSDPADVGRCLRPKVRGHDGRLEVLLYDGTGRAGRRSCKVHLLVFAAFNPRVVLAEDQDVDHVNTNPRDNRPSNLRPLPMSVNRSSRRDELIAATGW